MQIDEGRLDGLVAEPQRDHCPVDAVGEKVHGRRVSQAMGGDALVPEGGAFVPSRGHMLGQQVAETVMAQYPTVLIREHRVIRFAVAFLQPRLEDRRRVPAQRRVAFLAPLAVTAHMGTGAEVHIAATQPDQFRRPVARSALPP